MLRLERYDLGFLKRVMHHPPRVSGADFLCLMKGLQIDERDPSVSMSPGKGALQCSLKRFR